MPKDESGRWTIDSVGEADWAMNKIGHARDQIAGINRAAGAEITRWQDWAAKERRQWQQRIDWFTHLLEDYARRRLAEQCPTDQDMRDEATWAKVDKRLRLPSGHVQARRDAGGFEVVDIDRYFDYRVESSGVDWHVRALRDEGFDVTMRSAEVRADDPRYRGFEADGIRSVVDQHGEQVPGLTWTEPRIVLGRPAPTPEERPAYLPPPPDSDLPEDVPPEERDEGL